MKRVLAIMTLLSFMMILSSCGGAGVEIDNEEVKRSAPVISDNGNSSIEESDTIVGLLGNTEDNNTLYLGIWRDVNDENSVLHISKGAGSGEYEVNLSLSDYPYGNLVGYGLEDELEGNGVIKSVLIDDTDNNVRIVIKCQDDELCLIVDESNVSKMEINREYLYKKSAECPTYEDAESVFDMSTGFFGTAGSYLKSLRASYELVEFAYLHHIKDLDDKQAFMDELQDAYNQLDEDIQFDIMETFENTICVNVEDMYNMDNGDIVSSLNTAGIYADVLRLVNIPDTYENWLVLRDMLLEVII